jgi:hypothetical protein
MRLVETRKLHLDCASSAPSHHGSTQQWPLLHRKDNLQGSEIPAVISPSRLVPGPITDINKPGTDGDRDRGPTRTDGDPQPTPARGTTITFIRVRVCIQAEQFMSCFVALCTDHALRLDRAADE